MTTTAANRQEEAERAAFLGRKLGQFERVAALGLTGLSMRRVGLTFRIGIDTRAVDEEGVSYGPGLVEAVIIGRERKVKVIPEGRMQRLKRKGLEKVGIHTTSRDSKEIVAPVDLTDAQLDQIIERWRAGQSARDLPFIKPEVP